MTSQLAPLRMMIDFDGTLVEPNVAIILVEKFCENGAVVAHEVDEELHAGKITLRQAWERQVALLPSDRIPEMVEFAIRNSPLRAGTAELLDLLKRHQVPTFIISGGLDFYIHPILENAGIDLPVYADAMAATPEGHLRVLHPYGHPTCRLCGICKANAVRSVRPGATRTGFAGDGSTDKFAAEVADLVFARRRLKLFCEEAGVPYYPFEDFRPVTAQLARWLEEGEPFPPLRRPGVTTSACPISRELQEGVGPLRSTFAIDEASRAAASG